MAYEFREKRFIKSGYIELYFRDKFVVSRQFKSPSERKGIIIKWEQQYRLSKADGLVYFQVKYSYINN
jgi:hypothetical protein